jgi:hypothetical protein
MAQVEGTCREIQGCKVMHEIVKCDNCGAEYVYFDTDNNEEPFLHRVCDTCYMTMKVKNPFL